MGRGKVEMKRIEDNVSRQVSFTKRRNGLMKKAHELSVLCDVDLALFVISGRNRLYEFSTGDSTYCLFCSYIPPYILAGIWRTRLPFLSKYTWHALVPFMTEILNRYQDHKQADEAARRIVCEELRLQYCTDVWTADELTQMIQRQLNGHNVQQSDVTELGHLQKQTESILQQVRTKKAQLMLAVVENLQAEQKHLRREKQLMVGDVTTL